MLICAIKFLLQEVICVVDMCDKMFTAVVQHLPFFCMRMIQLDIFTYWIIYHELYQLNYMYKSQTQNSIRYTVKKYPGEIAGNV